MKKMNIQIAEELITEAFSIKTLEGVKKHSHYGFFYNNENRFHKLFQITYEYYIQVEGKEMSQAKVNAVYLEIVNKMNKK